MYKCTGFVLLGGLVTSRGGRRTLVGVVSFGETGCVLRGRPGVYTNISSHVAWVYIGF